jgi:hypothetical protein
VSLPNITIDSFQATARGDVERDERYDQRSRKPHDHSDVNPRNCDLLFLLVIEVADNI